MHSLYPHFNEMTSVKRQTDDKKLPKIVSAHLKVKCAHNGRAANEMFDLLAVLMDQC